ncbi:hypothetical protein PT974_08791 [Cladobotryum mycophilum]|uniref:Centromere protein H C-terminal domain-containing protein n=1 Tax=Cladobotryum mycophilum TaxID=491253 RepID=A0ABR0SEB0_9HYPO
MSDIEDESMANGHDDEARLPLSEDELRVLELYDKFQELMLEIAIINAQSKQNAASDEETLAAQNALLEARAKYRLRNDAVEAVMMANPILKAVHNGTQASPVERDLLPYVQQRDETTISVAKHAADVGKLRTDMSKVQVETIRVCRENVALTAQLFELTEQARQKTAGHVDDPEARDDLERLEREVKSSRQRWRVMKGVASGIIAGSGIDWVRNDDLRDIVLDPESED